MFTLTIFLTSEGEYQYDIYLTSPVDEDESYDGGVCTGSLEEAVEMANAQVSELIKRGIIK